MASINFPTRTPVGVILPNQTVPPEGSITIRVNSVSGTGANGGGTDQKGFPDTAAMIDGNGYVLPIFATLTPVADMAYGAQSGEAVKMKLTKSIPAYTANSLPAYYDLIFDPWPGSPASGSAKLDVMQHFEFFLKASLPVVWMTMPSGGAGPVEIS